MELWRCSSPSLDIIYPYTIILCTNVHAGIQTKTYLILYTSVTRHENGVNCMNTSTYWTFWQTRQNYCFQLPRRLDSKMLPSVRCTSMLAIGLGCLPSCKFSRSRPFDAKLVTLAWQHIGNKNEHEGCSWQEIWTELYFPLPHVIQERRSLTNQSPRRSGNVSHIGPLHGWYGAVALINDHQPVSTVGLLSQPSGDWGCTPSKFKIAAAPEKWWWKTI